MRKLYWQLMEIFSLCILIMWRIFILAQLLIHLVYFCVFNLFVEISFGENLCNFVNMNHVFKTYSNPSISLYFTSSVSVTSFNNKCFCPYVFFFFSACLLYINAVLLSYFKKEVIEVFYLVLCLSLKAFNMLISIQLEMYDYFCNLVVNRYCINQLCPKL